MYSSKKDLKHNLFLFFIDGVSFTPAMTLISVSAVIPYFLVQIGATTFQIGLAASVALVCTFVAQPFFGYVATHSKVMNKTFGKILLLQRLIFLAFVLCIPVFVKTGVMLVWIFLFFWGLFHIFVGSYSVFYAPLVLTLLPPDKRGAIRGMGHATGCALGLGIAALIPVLLGRISFPYNYTLVFFLGSLFLIINAFVFLFMRQHDAVVLNIPLSISQYLKEMLFSVRRSAPFRAMILTCMFLVTANSLLPYYTLYAIRVFSAAEYHIAILTALAVLSNAFAHILFGSVLDRRGPKPALVLAIIFVISAGVLALFTNSISFLFIAWASANIGNIGYMMSSALLIGEVSPSGKLPLYVGVQNTISLILSSAVLLLLAPVLESVGFMLLFAVVLGCGFISVLIYIFIFRKFSAPAAKLPENVNHQMQKEI